MAVFIYVVATGRLHSWCPSDSDQVADDVTLQANGMAKVSGLPPLDDTHVWHEGNKTVVAAAARLSTPAVLEFWRRFTPAEREALENLAATGTQGQKNKLAAFKTYVQTAGFVDCNDSYIQGAVNLMESANVIGSGRAAQILV